MLRDILNKYSNATAINATYAIPDRLNDHRIAQIAEMQVAIPIKIDLSASGEVISNWWLVHFADIENVEVAIWPPSTYEEIMALNPNAISAEPFAQQNPLINKEEIL